jgi:hypothetical protein
VGPGGAGGQTSLFAGGGNAVLIGYPLIILSHSRINVSRPAELRQPSAVRCRKSWHGVCLTNAWRIPEDLALAHSPEKPGGTNALNGCLEGTG